MILQYYLIIIIIYGTILLFKKTLNILTTYIIWMTNWIIYYHKPSRRKYKPWEMPRCNYPMIVNIFDTYSPEVITDITNRPLYDCISIVNRISKYVSDTCKQTGYLPPAELYIITNYKSLYTALSNQNSRLTKQLYATFPGIRVIHEPKLNERYHIV